MQAALLSGDVSSESLEEEAWLLVQQAQEKLYAAGGEHPPSRGRVLALECGPSVPPDAGCTHAGGLGARLSGTLAVVCAESEQSALDHLCASIPAIQKWAHDFLRPAHDGVRTGTCEECPQQPLRGLLATLSEASLLPTDKPGSSTIPASFGPGRTDKDSCQIYCD